MSDRMLREFRQRAEGLVSVPDLGELHKRGARLRRVRFAAAAVAVVVSAVVIGAVMVTGVSGDKEEIRPAPHPSEEIARDFLDAYGAFGADRAIALLTDTAVAEAWDSEEGFRLELSRHQAIGYEQTIKDCQPQSHAGGVEFRCAFDLQALRSDELGLGPYTGNDWYLTIRDGKVVSAWFEWAYDTNGFNDQIWAPFHEWISAEHPNDVATMYENAATPRTTAGSVPLWRRRTTEYVQIVTQDISGYVDQPAAATYIDQLDSICTSAHARLNDQSPGVEVEPWRTQLAIATTLPTLQTIPPPAAVRYQYLGRAFPLMDQFARQGTVAPFVHEVAQFPGLSECTFGLTG